MYPVFWWKRNLPASHTSLCLNIDLIIDSATQTDLTFKVLLRWKISRTGIQVWQHSLGHTNSILIWAGFKKQSTTSGWFNFRAYFLFSWSLKILMFKATFRGNLSSFWYISFKRRRKRLGTEWRVPTDHCPNNQSLSELTRWFWKHGYNVAPVAKKSSSRSVILCHRYWKRNMFNLDVFAYSVLLLLLFWMELPWPQTCLCADSRGFIFLWSEYGIRILF